MANFGGFDARDFESPYPPQITEVEKLKERIRQLEAENARLVEALKHMGLKIFMETGR